MELMKGITLMQGISRSAAPLHGRLEPKPIQKSTGLFHLRLRPFGFDSHASKNRPKRAVFSIGADEGNRTPNLLITNELLYH